MIDAADAALALRDLREARRRNHRAVVHWVDALYKVYVTAVGSAIFVVIASGWLGDTKVDAATAERVATEGPAWLGLAFAAAIGLGLRSGGRGGPLALEAPAVQHELLAPVDRLAALRGPAEKQLRFLAYAGAVVGGCIGVLAARRLVVNPAEIVVTSAAAFALAGVAAGASGMAVSGRRLGIWAANGVAIALLAWSALDVALRTTTSPITMLASIALFPLHIQPLALIGVAAVAAVIAVALVGLRNTSLEDARRRAGLVTQLRFAVTLQDIRTVVLLRRQLAQESPRHDPWIRTRRGRGRLPETWRRDWQSYLRFPASRVVRLLALATIAGLSMGLVWKGLPAAFLVAALAMFVAAYEAVEPIAQEVDHPSRWSSLRLDHGTILLRHLPAAGSLMILLCLVATAVSLTMVPGSVVAALAPSLVPVVALAATLGASLSTVLGGSTTSSIFELDAMQQAGGGGMDLQGVGLDTSMMGFVQMIRLALPPGLVVAALAPVLRAGSNPDAPNTAAVANTTTMVIVALVGILMWLRYRRPARI